MGQLRIKGQETFVTIVENGAPVAEFNAIADWTITYEMEVLEEGYIGETEQRYDTVFNGISFDSTMHMETSAQLDLAERLKLKAQRRAGAAGRVDITTTFVFPGGVARTLVLVDFQNGPLEISGGGRAEYVSFKLPGNCSKCLLIPA